MAAPFSFGQPAGAAPGTSGAPAFGSGAGSAGFGGGGFGAAQPGSSPGGFGGGGFGSGAAAGGFGTPAGGASGAGRFGGGFGSGGSGFGTPSPSGGVAGGFGASSGGGAAGGFGVPASPVAGGFGAPSPGGGGFGAGGSGFGTPSPSGGVAGGFGASSGGGAAGGFGVPASPVAGGFGASAVPAAGGFGSPPAAAPVGFGLSSSAGTGGFGSAGGAGVVFGKGVGGGGDAGASPAPDGFGGAAGFGRGAANGAGGGSGAAFGGAATTSPALAFGSGAPGASPAPAFGGAGSSAASTPAFGVGASANASASSSSVFGGPAAGASGPPAPLAGRLGGAPSRRSSPEDGSAVASFGGRPKRGDRREARRSGPAPGAGGAGLAMDDAATLEARAARFAAKKSSTSADAERAPAPPRAGSAASRRPPTPSAASAFEADGEEGGYRRSPGSQALVGTCEDMCPAAERERRENLHDVAVFERVDPSDPGRTDRALAVRRFARTIDDPAPSDFRTRGALARTMAHLRSLLDAPAPRADGSGGAASGRAQTMADFGLVHKFLWDRYRAVRQDLYVQGIEDAFAIEIYEEIVRFHVLCEHELAGEGDQSAVEVEGFNSHLNVEQMNKTLISLCGMYDAARKAGRPAPREAEFRAYHLILLASEHGKFRSDREAFLSALRDLAPPVASSPEIRLALRLHRAIDGGNFVAFFDVVRRAPYLVACLASVYFTPVRLGALRTLSETLAPSPARPAAVELAWLRRVLMLDSEEQVAELCASAGFETGRDHQSGAAVVLLVKGAYERPPPPLARVRSLEVAARAPKTRAEAVLPGGGSVGAGGGVRDGRQTTPPSAGSAPGVAKDAWTAPTKAKAASSALSEPATQQSFWTAPLAPQAPRAIAPRADGAIAWGAGASTPGQGVLGSKRTIGDSSSSQPPAGSLPGPAPAPLPAPAPRPALDVSAPAFAPARGRGAPGADGAQAFGLAPAAGKHGESTPPAGAPSSGAFGKPPSAPSPAAAPSSAPSVPSPNASGFGRSPPAGASALAPPSSAAASAPGGGGVGEPGGGDAASAGTVSAGAQAGWAPPAAAASSPLFSSQAPRSSPPQAPPSRPTPSSAPPPGTFSFAPGNPAGPALPPPAAQASLEREREELRRRFGEEQEAAARRARETLAAAEQIRRAAEAQAAAVQEEAARVAAQERRLADHATCLLHLRRWRRNARALREARAREAAEAEARSRFRVGAGRRAGGGKAAWRAAGAGGRDAATDFAAGSPLASTSGRPALSLPASPLASTSGRLALSLSDPSPASAPGRAVARSSSPSPTLSPPTPIVSSIAEALVAAWDGRLGSRRALLWKAVVATPGDDPGVALAARGAVAAELLRDGGWEEVAEEAEEDEERGASSAPPSAALFRTGVVALPGTGLTVRLSVEVASPGPALDRALRGAAAALAADLPARLPELERRLRASAPAPCAVAAWPADGGDGRGAGLARRLAALAALAAPPPELASATLASLAAAVRGAELRAGAAPAAAALAAAARVRGALEAAARSPEAAWGWPPRELADSRAERDGWDPRAWSTVEAALDRAQDAADRGDAAAARRALEGGELDGVARFSLREEGWGAGGAARAAGRGAHGAAEGADDARRGDAPHLALLLPRATLEALAAELGDLAALGPEAPFAGPAKRRQPQPFCAAASAPVWCRDRAILGTAPSTAELSASCARDRAPASPNGVPPSPPDVAGPPSRRAPPSRLPGGGGLASHPLHATPPPPHVIPGRKRPREVWASAGPPAESQEPAQGGWRARLAALQSKIGEEEGFLRRLQRTATAVLRPSTDFEGGAGTSPPARPFAGQGAAARGQGLAGAGFAPPFEGFQAVAAQAADPMGNGAGPLDEATAGWVGSSAAPGGAEVGGGADPAKAAMLQALLNELLRRVPDARKRAAGAEATGAAVAAGGVGVPALPVAAGGVGVPALPVAAGGVGGAAGPPGVVADAFSHFGEGFVSTGFRTARGQGGFEGGSGAWRGPVGATRPEVAFSGAPASGRAEVAFGGGYAAAAGRSEGAFVVAPSSISGREEGLLGVAPAAIGGGGAETPSAAMVARGLLDSPPGVCPGEPAVSTSSGCSTGSSSSHGGHLKPSSRRERVRREAAERADISTPPVAVGAKRHATWTAAAGGADAAACVFPVARSLPTALKRGLESGAGLASGLSSGPSSGLRQDFALGRSLPTGERPPAPGGGGDAGFLAAGSTNGAPFPPVSSTSGASQPPARSFLAPSGDRPPLATREPVGSGDRPPLATREPVGSGATPCGALGAALERLLAEQASGGPSSESLSVSAGLQAPAERFARPAVAPAASALSSTPQAARSPDEGVELATPLTALSAQLQGRADLVAALAALLRAGGAPPAEAAPPESLRGTNSFFEPAAPPRALRGVAPPADVAAPPRALRGSPALADAAQPPHAFRRIAPSAAVASPPQRVWDAAPRVAPSLLAPAAAPAADLSTLAPLLIAAIERQRAETGSRGSGFGAPGAAAGGLSAGGGCSGPGPRECGVEVDASGYPPGGAPGATTLGAAPANPLGGATLGAAPARAPGVATFGAESRFAPRVDRTGSGGPPGRAGAEGADVDVKPSAAALARALELALAGARRSDEGGSLGDGRPPAFSEPARARGLEAAVGGRAPLTAFGAPDGPAPSSAALREDIAGRRARAMAGSERDAEGGFLRRLPERALRPPAEPLAAVPVAPPVAGAPSLRLAAPASPALCLSAVTEGGGGAMGAAGGAPGGALDAAAGSSAAAAAAGAPPADGEAAAAGRAARPRRRSREAAARHQAAYRERMKQRRADMEHRLADLRTMVLRELEVRAREAARARSLETKVVVRRLRSRFALPYGSEEERVRVRFVVRDPGAYRTMQEIFACDERVEIRFEPREKREAAGDGTAVDVSAVPPRGVAGADAAAGGSAETGAPRVALLEGENEFSRSVLAAAGGDAAARAIRAAASGGEGEGAGRDEGEGCEGEGSDAKALAPGAAGDGVPSSPRRPPPASLSVLAEASVPTLATSEDPDVSPPGPCAVELDVDDALLPAALGRALAHPRWASPGALVRDLLPFGSIGHSRLLLVQTIGVVRNPFVSYGDVAIPPPASYAGPSLISSFTPSMFEDTIRRFAADERGTSEAVRLHGYSLAKRLAALFEGLASGSPAGVAAYREATENELIAQFQIHHTEIAILTHLGLAKSHLIADDDDACEGIRDFAAYEALAERVRLSARQERALADAVDALFAATAQLQEAARHASGGRLVRSGGAADPNWHATASDGSSFLSTLLSLRNASEESSHAITQFLYSIVGICSQFQYAQCVIHSGGRNGFLVVTRLAEFAWAKRQAARAGTHAPSFEEIEA